MTSARPEMLRAIIKSELTILEKIVRNGGEVVPRFRIIAADGEHTVVVPMPDDSIARNERLHVVRALMVFQAATGFVRASELIEPDAIVALAVTLESVVGAAQRIARNPLSFAVPEWFGREAVGDELIDLLPLSTERLNDDEIRFVQRALAGDVPGIRCVAAGEKL